ncbi:MAG: hypothetical protein HOY76_20745 [Streptomyces sp.]|nr:hypothetical protein [Streptomyces sp.]NUS16427.1 hypothetical protein [Streptomyces sp.]
MAEPRNSLSPLKDGLTPGRRALAEDLRTLFRRLDISVRRYATRRSYDYTTISRYLSGERTPAWEFIVNLVADVGEAEGRPLMPEAEQTLRQLHEEALRDTPKAHEIEVLKHRLAEADEETRRIKTTRKALAEALGSREQSLADVRRRCQALEQQLHATQQAHGQAVQVWSEQFERLQAERDRLSEEVLHLREVLAVTQAELFSAEQECSRLEEQLEHAQELPAEQPPAAASLIQLLETTDRTATIPELVSLVGGLETSTRQAVAHELVSSVTLRRTVQDVAELLVGLYKAGFHRHAKAALPALVAARPLDTAELIVELSEAGLGEPLETLLTAAVELLSPAGIARLGNQLHQTGLHEQAAAVVGAATTRRAVVDAVEVITRLDADHVPELLSSAVSAPARYRAVSEVVRLLVALRRHGLQAAADALDHGLAEYRPAADIVDLLSALGWAGLESDADAVFRVTQTRPTAHLVALVSALHSANLHDAAAKVLTGVISTRPIDDIAAVISDLFLAGRRQDAAGAMTSAVQHLGRKTAALLASLDERAAAGGHKLLDLAAGTASSKEAATLVTTLLACSLPSAVGVVFDRTVQGRPTGHAGAFLNLLNTRWPTYLDEQRLRDLVRNGTPTQTARLILALDSARMSSHLTFVLQDSCIERPAPDVAMLLATLDRIDHGSRTNRSADIIDRVLLETVDQRRTTHQVDLLLALEEVNLYQHSSHLQAAASSRVRNPRAGHFKKTLASRRRVHQPRWYSPAVFSKGPDPSSSSQ